MQVVPYARIPVLPVSEGQGTCSEEGNPNGDLPSPREFPTVLRTLRERSGKSNYRMAEISGLDEGYLAGWSRGSVADRQETPW